MTNSVPGPCVRRWSELKPLGNGDDVRFCDGCQQCVHRAESLDEARSLGSQGLCAALLPATSVESEWIGFALPQLPESDGVSAPVPATDRSARMQFLVAWDPEKRRAQLDFLLNHFAEKPWSKPLFAEFRSGVRYEVSVRGPDTLEIEGARELLRSKGIALRVDPLDWGVP